MESKSSGMTTFVWKSTVSDGTVPVRRLEDGRKEFEPKEMKKPPNVTDKDLIDNGLVKNIKKARAITFVDEKTKRKFRDGEVYFCKSLKCYVQIKSFDPDTLTYKSRIHSS